MTHLMRNFTTAPPFTIVRICELLTEPTKHYNKPKTFLRALEGILCVSSTTKDFDNTVVAIDEIHKQSSNSDDPTKQKEVLSVQLDTNDAQTILLTKIDWLTKEDIAEIENENYMMEAEFGLSEIYDEDLYSKENDYHNYDELFEESNEATIRKRKSDEDSKQKTEESVNSSDKRHKVHTTDESIINSSQNIKEASIVNVFIQDNLNVELQDEQQFNLYAGSTITEQPIITTVTELVPELEVREDDLGTRSDKDITFEGFCNDEGSIHANVTLEEDKMDIDTTF